MLRNDRRQQRRQHQHMGDVVAIVGHQHRLLARQNDDVANRVFLYLKLVHLQGVLNKRVRTDGGHRCVGSIGHIAHQVEVTVQLLGELFTGQ